MPVQDLGADAANATVPGSTPQILGEACIWRSHQLCRLPRCRFLWIPPRNPCALVLFPLLILAGGLAALLDSAKQPENQHPTAGASCSRARTLGKS